MAVYFAIISVTMWTVFVLSILIISVVSPAEGEDVEGE